MLAAGALFLLGAGLTAAGVLWPGLYDVGILVLGVAALGILVRAGDWIQVALASRAPRHDLPSSRHDLTPSQRRPGVRELP